MRFIHYIHTKQPTKQRGVKYMMSILSGISILIGLCCTILIGAYVALKQQK